MAHTDKDSLEIDTTRDPRQELTRWLRTLNNRGLLWHQDDDPRDCLRGAALSPDQIDTIAASHDAAWQMAEAAGIDIHEIALEVSR